MSAKRFALALLALATITIAFAPTAAAHASANTADGKYRVTWGLLDEPGYTHEKNKLDLIIRELVDPATNQTGAGVGGLTAENLTAELHIGEEHYELGAVSAYRGAKGATVGAGNYSAANPIYLTRPGIYTLHLEGDIRGSAVNMEIQAAHPYESIGDIAFPDEYTPGTADTSALEARIAALEAKAATQSATPAPVTTQVTPPSPTPLGGMLVALGLVAAALLLRRRKA